MTLPPGSLVQGDQLTGPDVGGGDGYDPWANVQAPRSGGNPMEVPVGPGGEMYTIPGPGPDGSIFMPNPDGSGVILVPKYVPDESPSPEASAAPSPDKTPAAATSSPSPSKTQKPEVTPGPTKKPPADEKPKKTEPNPTPKKESPSPSSKDRTLRRGQEQET